MNVITNKGNRKPDTSALDKLDSLNIQEDDSDVMQIPGAPAPGTPASTQSTPPVIPEDPTPADPQNTPIEDPSNPQAQPNQDTENTIDRDYRRKFAESSREAQILASKNKKLIDTIEQAAILSDISEDELRVKYSNWDDLDDFQKKMAKEAELSTKRFNMIHKGVLDTKKVDEWAAVVDEFVGVATNLQKYPDIEGHEAEFRSFCMKDNRRNLSLDELAEWFGAVSDKEVKPQQRGSLVARGGGGVTPQKPQQGMTIEQLQAIRRTNHRLYKHLVQTGQAAKVFANQF